MPARLRGKSGRVPQQASAGQIEEQCEGSESKGSEKDIARGTTSTATELDQQASYADALIADPRNDSHAIISQMLVLFHELHNFIVDELVRGGISGPTENRYADADCSWLRGPRAFWSTAISSVAIYFRAFCTETSGRLTRRVSGCPISLPQANGGLLLSSPTGSSVLVIP